MTMDFSPSPHVQTSVALSKILNAALIDARDQQKPRTYLGGSRLGVECLRALGYEYSRTPKDPDRGFSGETYRIFDMGHDGEERMIEYLRLAGFKMVTEKPGGGQIGFAIAPHPETGEPRIAGHLDGVIVDGPEIEGAAWPALWECKYLGDKGWKDTLRKGLKISKPIYYAQVQTYMAYLDLSANPCLFTAVNRNTGEIYAELVPFDALAAQTASDRGACVVSAMSPDELPRIGKDQTDFRCKWCDYAARCWEEKQASATAAPWAWGGNNAAVS